jgi:hypothetical protein
MSEQSEVTSPLVKALNSLPYVWATRLHSGKVRGGRQHLCKPGTPDVFAVVRGTPVFFEGKADDGRVSDAQIEQVALIEAAGGCVYVVRSVGEALGVVRRLLGRTEQ